MAEIEQLAKQLPAGFGIEWTAMSYQERQAGSQTPLLYTLSLMIVFLCLAAMYESWSVPTAVLLAAPLVSSAQCWPIPSRAWSATSISRWRC